MGENISSINIENYLGTVLKAKEALLSIFGLIGHYLELIKTYQ
jgi:hypothetical protein